MSNQKKGDDICKAFMPHTVSKCKQCSTSFIEKMSSCNCGANERKIENFVHTLRPINYV